MTSTRTQEPDLMTPGEVAARFGVDPHTVARWARAGRLPAVRTPGGHRRYRRADVEALATAPDERDRRVAEQIAEQVIAMQDEYLPSLGLDPAWIAGWRAAMRHAAARIAGKDVR